MNWLDKLEKKFGRYAIHNLMYYVIILNLIGFFIYMLRPEIYYDYLSLSVPMILRGQVWRIFTFVLLPPSLSMIGMFFFCMLYLWIGQSLENTWGAFRFNVYLFSGVILHLIAAFLVYFIFHIDLDLNLTYLNTSLFLAFGAEFPEMEILIFFILPVKVKWLAILDGVIMAVTIGYGFVSFAASLGSSYPDTFALASSIAALVSFLNFLYYFWNSRRMASYHPAQIRRKTAYKAKMKHSSSRTPAGTRHMCAVCGRTEKDDPNLEFRFCSKCDGAYEYCMDHLYTHKHVTHDQSLNRQ